MNHKISYWLTPDNIIQKVDENWDSSMDAESWTDRASCQGIIGKSLFDFICDDITRMYVASMIQTVRVIPQSLFRPYRCDTPDTKRFMMMIVTPEDDAVVRVSHELLRSEPMAKKAKFQTMVLPAGTHQKRLLMLDIHHIRCSMCNRLRKVGQNQWHEVDTETSGSLSDGQTFKVLYGLCPKCMNLPIQ